MRRAAGGSASFRSQSWMRSGTGRLGKSSATARAVQRRWRELRDIAGGMTLLTMPRRGAARSGRGRPSRKAARSHRWDCVPAISGARLSPLRYCQSPWSTRGRGQRKIRDQPHALEPTLSKEIELGPESVGRLFICETKMVTKQPLESTWISVMSGWPTDLRMAHHGNCSSLYETHTH